MTISILLLIAGFIGFVVCLLYGLNSDITAGIFWPLMCVVSAVVIVLSAASAQSYIDADKCASLRSAGQHAVMSGRCWVEVRPGLYQAIGGKRVIFITEKELKHE